MISLLNTNPMASFTENFLAPQAGATELSIPILMYHEIAPPERVEAIAQKTQRSFIVTIEQFETQMQWLVDNGFRAVTLADLPQILSGTRPRRPGEKPVIITFDDGFAGNYFHAFPVLRRLN